MNQPNFESAIKLIVEFFSELPPGVLAFIAGFGFFSLMVFCGYTLAFVVSFFVLFLTQNGIFILVSFITCIAGFSIYGIFQGFRMYKNIKNAYQQQQPE